MHTLHSAPDGGVADERGRSVLGSPQCCPRGRSLLPSATRASWVAPPGLCTPRFSRAVRQTFLTGRTRVSDNHSRLRRTICLPQSQPRKSWRVQSRHCGIGCRGAYQRLRNACTRWSQSHEVGFPRCGSSPHSSLARCGSAGPQPQAVMHNEVGLSTLLFFFLFSLSFPHFNVLYGVSDHDRRVAWGACVRTFGYAGETAGIVCLSLETTDRGALRVS